MSPATADARWKPGAIGATVLSWADCPASSFITCLQGERSRRSSPSPQGRVSACAKRTLTGGEDGGVLARLPPPAPPVIAPLARRDDTLPLRGGKDRVRAESALSAIIRPI